MHVCFAVCISGSLKAGFDVNVYKKQYETANMNEADSLFVTYLREQGGVMPDLQNVQVTIETITFNND